MEEDESMNISELDKKMSVKIRKSDIVRSVQAKVVEALQEVDTETIESFCVGQSRLHRTKSVTITANEDGSSWTCEESMEDDGLILYVAIRLNKDGIVKEVENEICNDEPTKSKYANGSRPYLPIHM